ncbi:MAG: NAD(P)/FAD-dependent oxidoreductase [archaeon]|nr:NAD(P)/FAD-dependent oxidoreductase [archaeon]MCP8317951.1 NAD(P)/FAD-dependent oxidoreductase [archaeon]MCP8320113.1 NAD(P)/FAD-dependent oxidoreductase [archaeon]
MYDVIVAGAGVAGCIVASLLAKKGFKVCLIDAKRAEDVGNKVCGDALISRGLDLLGFEPPMDVITNVASALHFHALGIKPIKLKTRIFLLDRLRFGQYLLHNAIENGSIFLDKCRAFAPILDGDKVIGIKAKINDSEVEFHAKVVIDASGINGVIRRKLPKDWWVSKSIEGYNLALCYREIRKLKRSHINTEYCEVFYDRKVVPSGYYWVFPKKDDIVNVGIGARIATINYDIRERLYKHVLINPIFDESEIFAHGFGIVPINPPLNCFTASGFIVIGDAAGQVNPFIGEGIRPSIISAYIAAEIIAKSKGFEQDDLWSYNTDFMKKLGMKHAMFAALSSFFEKLDYEKVKSLLSVFEGGTYNFGDFEDFNISLLLTLRASLKGFKQLKSILKEISIINSVHSIYREYPDSPKNFLEWLDRVKRFWKGYH